MKKIIALLICLILVFSLCACGKQKDEKVQGDSRVENPINNEEVIEFSEIEEADKVEDIPNNTATVIDEEKAPIQDATIVGDLKKDYITANNSGFAVCHDGAVYYDTGNPAAGINESFCVFLVMSTTDSDKVPNMNQQCNFGTGHRYQLIGNNQMIVEFPGGTCRIFESK